MIFGWQGKLAGLFAALLAIFGIHRSGVNRERDRQEARRAAEHAESMGKHVETMTKAKEVRDEVETVSGDDLDDRLRRWTRDKDN